MMLGLDLDVLAICHGQTCAFSYEETVGVHVSLHQFFGSCLTSLRRESHLVQDTKNRR